MLRVEGLEFRVWVEGFGFWVLGSRFSVKGVWHRILSLGLRGD